MGLIQGGRGYVTPQVWGASARFGGVGVLLADLSVPGAVTAVNLSGTSLSNIGAYNQGAVIGAITLSPNGVVQSTPVVVGGADAAYFSVTNGGIVPCNLIAAVDIPAGGGSGPGGTYAITLSAT